MERLLHWDFSLGLEIESHVRDKFRSTVHFSLTHPGSSKEFYLVVSFSSASFPLTEESVALALQSCIGGISSGFRVLRLSDRRFRLSVASNRVGHYSYGLKDRIWPDFVCHFHLFRGEINSALDHSDNGWHANCHLSVVGSRSVAIKSKWLQDQQDKIVQSTSQELNSERDMITNDISFGKFQFPIISDPIFQIRFGDVVL